MKTSTTLKLSLFSFICAIISVIAYVITNIEFMALLILVFAIICVISLIGWICAKIFKKFRYSLNLIAIFIFACTSVVLGFITDGTVGLSNINDYMNLTIPAIAFIASALACFVSLIVLIGRVIFRKQPDLAVATVAEDIHAATAPAVDVVEGE